MKQKKLPALLLALVLILSLGTTTFAASSTTATVPVTLTVATEYHMLNTDHPEDFRGHSLSVSDIVALKEQGVVSYHYVDSIGYTELPNFDKNYLKAAEMQLEDDYGMIDGIVNNGAKQPEQNQPVKAADDRSKRPSVLAKLRKLQAEDKQTAARHRSAERDEI